MTTEKHILIVDDEFGTRESLRVIFEDKHRVLLAKNAREAMDQLSAIRVDLVLLDIGLPDKDGLEVLSEILSIHPDIPVICVTAVTSANRVVQAMRAGAHDYITKPFDVEEIRHTVERTLASNSLHRHLETLQTEISKEFPVEGIVGQSAAFQLALDNTRKAAETDATVLICGDSGTGKELIARLIHNTSPRKDEPFVGVHCAALSETLMESELFGHEKGAFTHADKRKLGRFDLAESGTLFFDEVSEMSLGTQVKLLRVLQEREFMRVGGTQVIRTNTRIVAATAKDLHGEVIANRFRDDLFYRLSVIPIDLPKLAERAEDIPLLARYFLNYFRHRMSVDTHDFDPPAMDCLVRYSWPGNVREMRNIIERMLVLHGSSSLILAEFLPKEFHEPNGHSPDRNNARPETLPLAESVNAHERQLIEDALIKTAGVQTRAAKLLGTTRRILKYRMEKLNIEVSKNNGA